MGAVPNLTNSRGDTLADKDMARLSGSDTYSSPNTGGPTPRTVYKGYGVKDPSLRAEMLMNWLTAGARPQPIDPGVRFKTSQDEAPILEKAGVGAGINGLFGFGNMIGDMQVKPIEPLKPINQSPLQKGVSYSQPAVPKMVG